MSDDIRALTTPAARLREYADELAETGEAGSFEMSCDIRAVLAEMEVEHLARLNATLALVPFALAADSPHAQQFGIGVHGAAFAEASRIVKGCAHARARFESCRQFTAGEPYRTVNELWGVSITNGEGVVVFIIYDTKKDRVTQRALDWIANGSRGVFGGGS